ncbi:hypothetical protein [Clostridium thermarum]|uniref:hypothetical protein n=1 Tax=Clostridium thermarum TaxID=1716543 RepID=UPI001120E262|nr:hypothetical protein [Clostridium thermarum]
MISYSNMDNMYTYDTNSFYNGRYNYMNNYNSMSPYGYCPFAANNNMDNNYMRNECPYRNNYYQYSPTAECITPAYPLENNYGNFNSNLNNWNMRMRTVSIEDIRD